MGAWRIIPADVVTVLRAVGTVAESLCGAADGLPVDAQAALAGTAGSAIIGDALHGFFEFHAPTLTAIGSRISASVGGASAATESYVLGDEEMAREQQAAAVAAGAAVAAARRPRGSRRLHRRERAMNPRCYPSGIDPGAIPGQDLRPDDVLAAAAALAAGGARVREAGATMLREWYRLEESYAAPEAGQLLAVMGPVEAGTRAYGDDVEQVAAALRRFADDVRPIKAALERVRLDACAFRDAIAGNPDWEYDQGLIDRNTALIRRVNTQQLALWDAERTCANAIRALYRAQPWHAATSNDDRLGYGLAELGTGLDTAWGAATARKDHCPKSALVSVKRFVWDGLVVDGLWGTVTGLGLLVGIDGADWDWQTMQSSWLGMSSLLGYANQGVTAAHAGEAWLGLGKGVLAWDRWSDDPARAAGGAVFNLGTVLIPAGATATGAKAAATVTATGLGARTATALARAAEVVKFTDPITLTTLGVRAALPRLADLTAGIRAATERLGDTLRMPDLRLPDLQHHLSDVRTPVVQAPGAVPHPAAQVRSHGHTQR